MTRGLMPFAALVLLCCTCQPIPKPTPVQPPAPRVVDAGVSDDCDRWAGQHAADLASAATAQNLSVLQVTRVFEGACLPYEEDGPDAAISSGLAAARTARASLVTDAGTLTERNPYK